MTWDIAVACLALSIKFHRDFLYPLYPVMAYEYLDLSPHKLSFEDFETAQRDILSAFHYRLSVNPQSLLDELWDALPSLRNLWSFDGGWNDVQNRTWKLLCTSTREPDVLRFPVSLLATAALVSSIIESLVDR
ncbi:hypothetical protein BDQ12DRAFT_591175, partial [Crucibulum laeve]